MALFDFYKVIVAYDFEAESRNIATGTKILFQQYVFFAFVLNGTRIAGFVGGCSPS